MNKFSVSLPRPEPERKVYGYQQGSSVYWQSTGGRWFLFNLQTGNSYLACPSNDYNSRDFTPIYEPFSINIGI